MVETLKLSRIKLFLVRMKIYKQKIWQDWISCSSTGVVGDRTVFTCKLTNFGRKLVISIAVREGDWAGT
jgi:hypothetical protein